MLDKWKKLVNLVEIRTTDVTFKMSRRHLPLLIRPRSVGTAFLYVFYNDDLIVDELAADQIFVNAVKP